MKSFSDFATCSVSKAASYSITQTLRNILQEQDTRLISVHTGPIETDMTDSPGISEIAELAEVLPFVYKPPVITLFTLLLATINRYLHQNNRCSSDKIHNTRQYADNISELSHHSTIDVES